MNAEITPTEIMPFNANQAPNAATITNEQLLSMFMTGPIAFPIMSALIPVFISSVLAESKSLIVLS